LCELAQVTVEVEKSFVMLPFCDLENKESWWCPSAHVQCLRPRGANRLTTNLKQKV
jgi:hypothetical protein